jgi:hypothetical protein
MLYSRENRKEEKTMDITRSLESIDKISTGRHSDETSMTTQTGDIRQRHSSLVTQHPHRDHLWSKTPGERTI